MSEKKAQSSLLRIATLLLGAMDTCSGLLLIFAPSFTLQLMGIAGVHEAVLIRFIGAFVAGVGSLYLLGLVCNASTGDWRFMKAIWFGTAWIRIWVGASTAVFIFLGQLSAEWFSVPVTDLLAAVFQIGILFSGRFPDND